MQRERGSFLEPIDLNQGSIPSSSPMDHSPSWDNMLSPAENRLSNYMLGPTDPNATSDTFHNLSGWDSGESSSNTNNLHNVTESRRTIRWSDFFSSPEPTIGASSSRPPTMQNYSSAPSTFDLNSDDGYARDSHDFHKSGPLEIDQNPTFHASSSNFVAFTSSPSASVDNGESPGLSLGPWGSSCKRKALEDTSGQFYPPAGTSTSDERQPSFSGDHHSRGNLNITPSVPNYQGQSPGLFPSSSSGGLATSRSNNEGHEPILLDNSGITSSRNLNAYSSSESRTPVTITMHPNGPLTQTRSAYGNELSRGGTNPYPPWNRPSGSHGPGLSGSEARSHEEVSLRTYRRNNNNNNNLEYPTNVSAQQDQVDWSFVPNSLYSRNHSTGLQAGPGSGGSRASSSAYTPPRLSPPAQNQQRWPETTWVPFHRGESESPIRRGHFFSHLNSQTDEAGPSSRPQNQIDQRSPAFLMDVAGDDVSGWRSLAAVESRHRLIRQVLSAMRRGVHLQAEDYMLVDPFMSGFAELNDRHRDMRLDVDNMSYEELLALEERIGNVNTGLSEEKIIDAMKRRKFESVGVSPNLEPCCVCQEDYVSGDDIGILDCGHEFHTYCIKHWLTVKNLCPICKTTALGI